MPTDVTDHRPRARLHHPRAPRARAARAARAGARRDARRARLSARDRGAARRGADAGRAGRLDAEGRRRPADDADAQTESGVVQLLVCDYRGGEVRGYVQYDADRLAEAPAEPSLFALFGQGYLAITFDLATIGERYQGIVPLDGETLARGGARAISSSPSRSRRWSASASRAAPTGARRRRAVPPASARGRGRARAAAHPARPSRMGACRRAGRDDRARTSWPIRRCRSRRWCGGCSTRRTRCACSPPVPLARGCRCTPEHIAGVLAKFSGEERREMADEDGVITRRLRVLRDKFPVAAEPTAACANLIERQ